MAETIGFEAFFVAGSQTSAFLYGVPDTGIIGLREIADHARQVAARTAIPILVDCDTGFGNAVNVTYAVEELIRSGVAALQIEDQEAPKKSGVSAGRRSIPADEAVGKIAAATDARDRLDPLFSICARCDVLGAEGGTLAEAIERCGRYFNEGRADLIWLNSIPSLEALKEACLAIPAPVVAVWGGASAEPSPAEYGAAGAKIALYPTVMSTIGITAAWRVMHDFFERGPVAQREFTSQMDDSKWGAPNRRRLLKHERVREIEDEFLPVHERRDYDGTLGYRR